MKIKIGFGYDVHRLEPGRALRLGGIEIPFGRGLAGHSDADALIHALIDALLGASGEGDIGRLFPDSDPAWKDARSIDLLSVVMERLRVKGQTVVNADTVIVAEAPRMSPHVAAMKRVLCPILGISEDALGIKGKTSEGTGDVGKGEAVACWATVLIKSVSPRKKRGSRG